MKKIDIIDLSKVISGSKKLKEEDIIIFDNSEKVVKISKSSNLDINKIKTIEDIKIILESLEISFSEDIINQYPLLKKFIKIKN